MKNFLLLYLFLFLQTGLCRDPISGSRFPYLSGIKSSKDSKVEWDQRYARTTFIYGKSPANFLAENYEYIPFEGSVLDMGMVKEEMRFFWHKRAIKSQVLI